MSEKQGQERRLSISAEVPHTEMWLSGKLKAEVAVKVYLKKTHLERSSTKAELRGPDDWLGLGRQRSRLALMIPKFSLEHSMEDTTQGKAC